MYQDPYLTLLHCSGQSQLTGKVRIIMDVVILSNNRNFSAYYIN